MWLSLISILSLATAAILLARIFRPVGIVDAILYIVALFMSVVLLAGYALSAVNVLNRLEAWAVASASVLFLVVAGWWVWLRFVRGMPAPRITRAVLWGALHGQYALIRQWWTARRRDMAGIGSIEKRLIVPLLFTVVVLWLVNFDLALHTTPHNWDSMTYHLARMAYYLQHGNIGYFDANYWAQVTHPKNSAITALYAYLISGRNENMTSLVQFVSYAVATVAVYGIARRLGRDRFSSLMGALIFALLIECLMQAITTQNDMLLTALIGIAVYALLAYRERGHRRYLLMCGICVGMGLGIKSSALLVGPSLAVIALYALFDRRTQNEVVGIIKRAWTRIAYDTAVLAGALIVASCLFALPAGYVENMRLYGSPIGTEYVRKLHSFEGESLQYVLLNGTRNLLRFGFDFLSFDGLPPGGIFVEMQRAVRSIPRDIVMATGIDLETEVATRAPFQYDKMPSSHEDASSWGVFGLALILPLALLTLVGLVRAPGQRILALALVLFVVAQAYSGPYDPWRGRYFIIAGVFAAPLVAAYARKATVLWRVYFSLIILLGCLAALTAVIGRSNNAPEEVYTMDRLQQLTRNRRNYYQPIRLFNEIVPADATVATCFGEDTFEYPLFGERLTRTLLPVNSFWKGQLPVPPEADYFLFSSRSCPELRLFGRWLGEDWYLTKMK